MTSIKKINKFDATKTFAKNFRALTIVISFINDENELRIDLTTTKKFAKNFRDEIITTNFYSFDITSNFNTTTNFFKRFDDELMTSFCKRFDIVDMTIFKAFSYYRTKFIASFNSNKFLQTFFFDSQFFHRIRYFDSRFLISRLLSKRSISKNFIVKISFSTNIKSRLLIQ